MNKRYSLIFSISLLFASVNPVQANPYKVAQQACQDSNWSIQVYNSCLSRAFSEAKMLERQYSDQQYGNGVLIRGGNRNYSSNPPYLNRKSNSSNYDYYNGSNYSQDDCIYQYGRKYCPINH